VSSTTAAAATLRGRADRISGAWAVTACVAAAPLVCAAPFPGVLPPVVVAGAVGVAAWTVWRPWQALLILAACVPLGSVLSALAGARTSLTDPLAAAYLLGAGIHCIARPIPLQRSPVLTVSCLSLVCLALAACIVELGTRTPYYPSSSAWWDAVWTFWSRGYYTDRQTFPAVVPGLQLAQGVLLVPLVAWLLSSRARDYRPPVGRMLAAGVAALGALSIVRVIEIATRSASFTDRLLTVLSTLRISTAVPDVNAAGSLFALASAICVGAAADGRARRDRATVRAAVAGLACTIAGLWLTSSRAAVASLPIAVLVVAVLASADRTSLTRRRTVAIAVTTVVGLMLAITATSRRVTNDTWDAYIIRREFVVTTWHMVRDHPLFGVGPGHYFQASARYVTPTLRHYYYRENAHNNFLQIAGELGPIALAAFVVLLLAALGPAGRCLRHRPVPWFAAGVFGAVVAFLVTCFGGHPLLSNDVAVSFWISLGLIASYGLSQDTRASALQSRAPLVLLVVAGALALSVPVRIQAARAALTLENVTVGGSGWGRRSDGLLTTTFTGSGGLYVPTTARRVRIAMQGDAGTRGSMEITFWLDGRLADRVLLDVPGWRTFSLPVPPAGGRRFRLLTFEARRLDGPDGPAPRVVVRPVQPAS
jgi:O-antigen ligase